MVLPCLCVDLEGNGRIRFSCLAKAARANPALSIAITQSSLCADINIKRLQHPPETLDLVVAFLKYSLAPTAGAFLRPVSLCAQRNASSPGDITKTARAYPAPSISITQSPLRGHQQATGCLFGSRNMTELFIIYVGAKNDLALGEWTSALKDATRATSAATDNTKSHEAAISREYLES